MEIFRFQRAHYRIQYPESARPLFVPEGDSTGSPVVDCCEEGIRYQHRAQAYPEIGTPVRGVVRFCTGAEAAAAGIVVRIQNREVALHLQEQAIPWRILLREQLFLRRRFPLCA